MVRWDYAAAAVCPVKMTTAREHKKKNGSMFTFPRHLKIKLWLKAANVTRRMSVYILGLLFRPEEVNPADG